MASAIEKPRRAILYLRWLRGRLPRATAAAALLFGLLAAIADGLSVGPEMPVGVPLSLIAAAAALWLLDRGLIAWSQTLAVLILAFQVLILLNRVPADLGAGGWSTAFAGPFALALTAVALLAVDAAPFAAALLSSVVLTTGGVALVGSLAGVPTPYSWVGFRSMSLSSAFALSCLGLGVVAYAFRIARPDIARALRWTQILAGAAVVSASVLFWLGLRSEAAVQRQRTIEATARGIAGEVATRVRFMTEALERLAMHGAGIGGWASPDDWASDARISLGSFSGFEAVWWVDASLHIRQEAYSEGSVEGLLGPRSAEDEEHLRPALLRARATGRPTVVGPMLLRDDGAAFSIVLPLSAIEQPEAFLVGLFSFESSFGAFFGNTAPDYDVALYVGSEVVLRRGPMDPPGPTAVSPIDVGGAPVAWSLAATPRPELLASLTTRLPDLILGSGLLVGLLLTLVIRVGGIAYQRSLRFEQAVDERTAELASTLDELRGENQARRRGESTLRLTRRVGRTLAAELDQETVVETVTDAVRRLTEAQLAVFLPAEGELRTDALTVSGSADAGLYPWVVQHHRELLARLVAGESLTRFEVGDDSGASSRGVPGSLLGGLVPSRFGSQRCALLILHTEPDRFGTAEKEVVTSLAAQAAIALDNARLYEEARAARDEAQAASAAKDRFMRMLSHELRNPLASITNAAEILRLRTRDAERGEPGEAVAGSRMMDIINRQVTHLSRMVDDLLDASRMKTGKISLEPRRLDLNSEVREIARAHAEEIREAGLELDVRLCARSPWVDADPTRLAQILGNLITNAIKSTPAGGTLTIAVDESDEEAIVSVRDTGHGIAEQQIPLLFEPFVQSEASVKGGRSGLGLGLAIVRGLVEAHGGEVEARSGGTGRGAEFLVRLPRRGPLPTSEEPSAVSESERQVGRGRRILVIEDHVDSAASLVELLEAEGHRVEVATDGAAGVEAAGRFRPHLVICDLGLPGLDGYEVARMLRADADLAGVELVALSGFGDDAAIRQAYESGFDEHLTKPIEPPTLRRLAAGLSRSSSGNVL